MRLTNAPNAPTNEMMSLLHSFVLLLLLIIFTESMHEIRTSVSKTKDTNIRRIGLGGDQNLCVC